jgi:deazaflavin-dependent oxidoreductase (nitroreductase family)
MSDAAEDRTNQTRRDAGQQQGSSAARPGPNFRSRQWRVGNALVSLLARAGLGPIHLLTVTGRKTGRSHTHPVVPVEHAGRRWLVAPYGAVAWVHNARAAGRVSLRYGRATRHYTVREVAADEAGPVLKRYVAVAGKTRAYFSATRDSPVADFIAEAGRHPVFELTPVAGDPPTP